MKLGMTAAAALIALTMVFVAGGATASSILNGPGPPVGSAPQVLMYFVTLASEPDLQGPAAHFTPYYSQAHLGLTQIILVNLDRTPHIYQLTGTPMVFSVGPFHSFSVVTYLSHPGVYTWTVVLPYPGAPFGATVGLVAVR